MNEIWVDLYTSVYYPAYTPKIFSLLKKYLTFLVFNFVNKKMNVI